MRRYVDYNLCGLNNPKTIQEAELPFKIIKCTNCGLVYTNPQPDRKLIKDHYQEDYYKEWIEKQMNRRIHMRERRLRDLVKYKKSGRTLDVGCGVGTFLKRSKEKGFEIYGTEISDYACKHAEESLRIDVFRGELEEARFLLATFDVVTVWHTLEHLPDPMAALREINRILKKDGLLVVAVPNLNNYITRLLYLLIKRKKLMLFSNQAKEWHLYHFSDHTISSMLEKAGFDIIKIDLDLVQLEPSKITVDFLAVIFHFVTRKNYGEAMRVYAIKAQKNN